MVTKKQISAKGMKSNALSTLGANQQSSNRESQLVKATFYLTQEHVIQLERIRLERMQKGQRTDKSALIREAIDLLSW